MIGRANVRTIMGNIGILFSLKLDFKNEEKFPKYSTNMFHLYMFTKWKREKNTLTRIKMLILAFLILAKGLRSSLSRFLIKVKIMLNI